MSSCDYGVYGSDTPLEVGLHPTRVWLRKTTTNINVGGSAVMWLRVSLRAVPTSCHIPWRVYIGHGSQPALPSPNFIY